MKNVLRSFFIIILEPFPTCRPILGHLQQTTFENIVAKGEISHDEQFPVLPQCLNSHLWRYFTCLPNCFQSRLLQICCICERVKVISILNKTHH